MNTNTILLSLIAFVVIYISATALKYALGTVFTSIFVISGSALANHYGGQSALLLTLIISPVLYIVVSDLFEKLCSVKLPFALVAIPRIEKQRIEPELVDVTPLLEAAPLQGEWISGKTPELTFQRPLIGDVTALPKPWL